MNAQLKVINDYLRSRGASGPFPATGEPFITISREAGAGGHLLSHLLTVRFHQETDLRLFDGWHVFDREICEIVARDPTLDASIEELLNGRQHSELDDFVRDLFRGESRHLRLQRKVFRVVRMLALVGKVIIVGSAGSFVTADIESGLRIRLVAPLDRRARWMMRKLGVDRDRALRLIAEQDRVRARLVRAFFDADIAAPVNYDAVWNTATINPDQIADSVADILRQRPRRRRTVSHLTSLDS